MAHMASNGFQETLASGLSLFSLIQCKFQDMAQKQEELEMRVCAMEKSLTSGDAAAGLSILNTSGGDLDRSAHMESKHCIHLLFCGIC